MATTNPKLLKRLALVAILVIFAAPMLVSWWLLNYTDYSRDNAAASHGTLIVPPRPLHDTKLTSLSDPSSQQHLHGKWSLLYLHTGMCGKDCVDNLYKMRQLRLAAGEYAPRIQRVMIVSGPDTTPLSEDQIQHFAGQLMLNAEENKQFSSLKIFSMSDEEDPLLERRLYLVDPLGNLMMSYAPDTEPGGIIKDLKRLLRYSRIG
jgi:cytochrome oxidase Cu insertion factor (SCO1/SenC/PrrC family)